MLKGEIGDTNEPKIQSDNKRILNLTTSASIWFSGAIGMAIGFDYYFIALVSIGFVILVSRLPRIRKNAVL